jgi:ribosome-associated translation inhibitor RaiA
MLKVVFKNLDSSELIRDFVRERVQSVIRKYPHLINHQIVLTLEMENSPTQAGPDLFSISVMIKGKFLKNFKLKKSADNLYHAIAEFINSFNHLLGAETERLLKRKKRSTLPDAHLSI